MFRNNWNHAVWLQGDEQSSRYHQWPVIFRTIHICRIFGNKCLRIRSSKLAAEYHSYNWTYLLIVFVPQAVREDGLNNNEIFLSLNNELIQTVFCYVLFFFDTNNSHVPSEFATITVKEQDFIRLIIQEAQQSFIFNGLEILDCNVATFLSVSGTVLQVNSNNSWW